MRLGTAHLTALELPPVALVRAAARAGLGAVGLRLMPASVGGVSYPLDAAARAELKRALRDEDVTVREVEFIAITPDIVPTDVLPLFEAGAELGAACVTVSGDDFDPERLIANFAALCDLAAPFGLRLDLEFMRWRDIATPEQAAEVVAGADRPNASVLVVALHLMRCGSGVAALADIPPARLRCVQLCDAPLAAPPTRTDIIAEAREGRLMPGEGALPLVPLLHALPRDIAISVEVPMPGLGAEARLVRAAAAARRVVAEARAIDENETTGGHP